MGHIENYMGTNTINDGPAVKLRQEDAATVMDAVRRIVRALRVSTRSVEREIGISGAQLFIMQQLVGEQSLSVNQLARLTMTHQSSVSVVVARLAERGLVARKASKEDARRASIELTAKGRRLLGSAPLTAQARLTGALQRLPADQVSLLASTIDAWIREAGIDHEPAQFFFEEDAATGGENG